MAVAGHDQSAAVLVTELDADRELIEAELEQLRCAKVAQVMPGVHRILALVILLAPGASSHRPA
jgi:hypothetical protein